MLFFNRNLGVLSYVVAGITAIVVPIGLGYAIFHSDPGACYDSPSALPLLLVIIPPYAAPALAVIFAINRRFEKSLPDGWLPTILASGILGQIGISAFGVLMAPPQTRQIFFSDVLLIPQGFCVGLVVSVVFWVVLYACGRKSAEI